MEPSAARDENYQIRLCTRQEWEATYGQPPGEAEPAGGGGSFDDVEGQSSLQSTPCALANQSGISISCGHFSRHSPHSVHQLARASSGMNVYRNCARCSSSYIIRSLYTSKTQGMLTLLGQGRQYLQSVQGIAHNSRHSSRALATSANSS